MSIKYRLRMSAVMLTVVLSACSTTPSVKVVSPEINIPKIALAVPSNVKTLCEPLVQYDSTDVRDVIRVTIRNHNIYFLCASKMKSAILFLELQSQNN